MGPRHFEGNSDPQYLYMMNSLALAAGSYPGHLDHPGATVHTLGAATLLAPRIGVSTDALIDEMLRDPEKMGRWIGAVLIAVSAVLIFLSGWFLASSSGFQLVHGLFFQLWPFGFAATWMLAPFIGPDFFLLCLAQLFCSLTLFLRPTWTSAIALGSMLGIMLATKITSVLFLAVPVLLFRKRLSLMIGVFASFGGVFLLLIGLVYRSHIKYFFAYMFNWVWGLATKRGWYGSGEAGLPGFEVLAGNLAGLALELPLLFIAAAICIFGGGRFFRRLTPRRELWLAMGLIAVGQILLVIKGGAPRYALPAVPAASLALLLMFFGILPSWKVKAQNLALSFLVLLAIGALSTARTRLTYKSKLAEEMLKAVPAERPIICSGLGSRPDCALHIGNNFSHNYFTEKLKSLYPDHFLWVPDAKEVLLKFGNSSVPLSEYIAEKGSAVFQGASLEIEGRSRLGNPDFQVIRIHEKDPRYAVWEAIL